MKLFVSDYDDTLFMDEMIMDKALMEPNKKEIERIRKKGHIFAIATGRSYLDLTTNMKEYGLSSDYMILCHGATIMKDNKVIFNKTLDNAIKRKIIDALDISHQQHYFACTKDNSRADIYEDNITKIRVWYETKEQAYQVFHEINEKYGDMVNCYLVSSNHGVEVVSKDVNKATSIAYVASLENINPKDIIVIGDNVSDINMIKTFNGYCVANAIEDVKKVSKKQYTSVAELLKDVL